MSVQISVPGRVCLVGEHNDWAGGCAIVVPMDRSVVVRARAWPTLAATAVFEGAALAWEAGEQPGPLMFVPAVARVLSDVWGRGCTGIVHIEGDLPAGRGFSSSAAVCVALVCAFSALHGRAVDTAAAAELAYRAEHDVCGINCGRLDPLACAWGKPLYLRFEGDAVDVEPVPANFALAVGSFRAPRDTAGILAALGRRFRGETAAGSRIGERTGGRNGSLNVQVVRDALEGFGIQARSARQALFAGDLGALGNAMDRCQEIYEDALMPALPELLAPGLVQAVRALRAAGALGAKFSGAGGDGSVIGLFAVADVAMLRGVAALEGLGLDAFGMEVRYL